MDKREKAKRRSKGSPKRAECTNGLLVRSLLAETVPLNVIAIRGNPREPDARAELLTTLVKYCRIRCGGCSLTDEIPP